MGAGKLFQPLRVALTGSAASPGIFDVLILLGRDRSQERMDAGRKHIALRRTCPLRMPLPGAAETKPFLDTVDCGTLG